MFESAAKLTAEITVTGVKGSIEDIDGFVRKAKDAEGAAEKFKESGTKMGDGFRKANLGDVSRQLQDVFVELQGGISPITIMSQQLPQLLSDFGKFGTVVGAGVAMAAFGLSKMMDELDDTTRKLHDAKNAASNLDEMFDTGEGVVHYGEKLYLLAQKGDSALQSIERLMKASTDIAFDSYAESASKFAESLTTGRNNADSAGREVQTLGISVHDYAQQVINLNGEYDAQAKHMVNGAALLDALKTQYGLTTPEAGRFLEVLLAVEVNKSPETIHALNVELGHLYDNSGRVNGPLGAALVNMAKLEDQGQKLIQQRKDYVSLSGNGGVGAADKVIDDWHQTHKDSAADHQAELAKQNEDYYLRIQQQANQAGLQGELAENARYKNQLDDLRKHYKDKGGVTSQFHAAELALENAHNRNLKKIHDDAFKYATDQEEKKKDRRLEIEEEFEEEDRASKRMAMSYTQDFMDEGLSMLEAAGKKQSGVYKAMFAMSKGLAVADIIVNTQEAAAKATGQLGFFGISAAAAIEAMGYARAGIVAGTALAGLFDAGGDIPAGKYGVVGERGPELVRGPANVTSRQATADLARQAMNGNQQSPTVHMTVVQHINGSGDAALKNAVKQAVEQAHATIQRDFASNGPARRLLKR